MQQRWALFKLLMIGTFAFAPTLDLFANSDSKSEKLIILSPHRKSIQTEFIQVFREHYKRQYQSEIQVDWLDQGGTADDVRFLRSKFAANPKSSGIDVFWGGGLATYLDLSKDKIFANYSPSAELLKEVPASVAGVPLYDASKTWYATALSSFGIFFNQKVVKFESLPLPQTWDDLGREEYVDQLIQTDARRSGTATTMNMIILQAKGWDGAWELFHRIAGNTKKFSHSSTDPIKAIVSGDAAVTMAIDFYANAKVSELGEKNLGFILPTGQTILDPDPAAILKGAPNPVAAERFMNFLLSTEAQNLLILPKGSPGGPKDSDLGRMAVNTKSYQDSEGKRIFAYNPFLEKSFLQVDAKEAASMQAIVSDLLGAMIIDSHGDLKQAWKLMIKEKSSTGLMKQFAAMPVTKEELQALAPKWNDEVLRNKTINAWVQFAKDKYSKIIKSGGKPS
jgi:iron(III) transport system substrate-binding protein